MLRFGALLAIIATAVTGTGAASDTRTGTTAALRLVDTTPVTLRGHGFRARERVRVTLVANQRTRSKIVYASRYGTFAAAFSAVASDPCNIRATAVGSSGSRAKLRELVDRMCPPPIVP